MTSPMTPPDTQPTAPDVSGLLPSTTPIRFIDEQGELVPDGAGGDRAQYEMPSPEDLLQVYRRMRIGRRFDLQATALTKQGRLAVYPSSRGQDACQVASTMAIEETDWFFPTYRDSMALVTRGIEPDQVLCLLQGDWHSGYDPQATRTAPQATPLATQMPHAAGTAYALARRGTDRVALAFIGDGATSEGDFHEGCNFAAVFNAPAVFLVQNNKYAISVPLAKQTKAPAIAYKGVGYGMASEQVDGNDPAAVLAVTRAAVARARRGEGPTLIEAHTYRLEAHTNADDATRYRTDDEVDEWTGRDPIARLETWLVKNGHLDDAGIAEIAAEAEEFAAMVRERLNTDNELDPLSLFDNVYDTPTPQLEAQRAMVAAELADDDSQEGAR